MSTDNENNIKVSINDDYDRILSNPEGLIMSDGLAERLEGEWDLAGALKRMEAAADDSVASDPKIEVQETIGSPSAGNFESVTTPEKNSIRVFSKDDSNIGLVYGEVQSFSSIDGDYSIGILVRGDHRKFMGTLMTVQKGDNSQEEFGFDVAGRNGFICRNA